jgi:hypothetical protein
MEGALGGGEPDKSSILFAIQSTRLGCPDFTTDVEPVGSHAVQSYVVDRNMVPRVEEGVKPRGNYMASKCVRLPPPRLVCC